MNTEEILYKTKNTEISVIEAMSIILQQTQKDSYLISLFVNDAKQWLHFYKYCLNSEIFEALEKLEGLDFSIEVNNTDKYSPTELSVMHNALLSNYMNVSEVIEHKIENNIESQDSEDWFFPYEENFFSLEFMLIEDLILHLTEYIKPHQSIVKPKEKPTSSDSKYHVVNSQNWNTSDRFDLLNALGFIKQLNESGLTTDEIKDVLAIILKTTPENARKTMYGTTNTQSNQTEQIKAYKDKFKSTNKD
jgi:hypothetical protein